jgi:hypothetical protein
MGLLRNGFGLQSILPGAAAGGAGGFARANFGKAGSLRNFWAGQATVVDGSSIADTSAIPNGYEIPATWAMAPKGGGLSAYTTIQSDHALTSNLAMGVNIGATLTSAHTMAPSMQAIANLVTALVSTGGLSATMQAFASLSAAMDSTGGLDGVDLGAVANMSASMASDNTLAAPLSLVVSMAASMLSDGSITTAGLSLLVQLAATMVASCDLMGNVGALSNMTVTMASEGQITAALSALANMNSNMIATGEIVGTMRGTLDMSATLSSTGDVVTAETCAAAVWNALVVQYQNGGSFGEAIANGSAGLTQQQIRDAMTLAASGGSVAGSIDAKLDSLPSAADIAAAVHSRVIEGSLTFEQATKITLAVLAGNATGLTTGVIEYKAQDGTTVRVGGNVVNGTRTIAIIDGQ